MSKQVQEQIENRRSQPPRERRTPEDPYMYLLLAVVAQAVRDARDRRSPKRAREAIEFLRAFAEIEIERGGR